MAATSSQLSPALFGLMNTLRDLQDRIARLERGARTMGLDLATIENGAMSLYDGSNNLRSLVGVQSDGTFAHTFFNGPPPLPPSAPAAVSGVNSIAVIWNGQMSDGSLPLSDFSFVEVHISTSSVFIPTSATLAGVLTQAGTLVVPNLTPGITYYAGLLAINTSTVASAPSAYTSATPASVVGSIPAGSITATQLGFTARNIGGISITVQGIPPASPQPDDLWYDTSNNNLLNVWTGSAWVPYQFGTNAIAVGSITAQLIAAGTIIAGAVDGTTITGAKFVATGTSGEILAYNGVPASGNLVMAVSPVAGSDSFGNAYYAGVTTFNGFGAVVNLLSTDHAAFFQYLNHATAVQGGLILAVASTSGTDPVVGTTYSAGLQGIDPVFGDFMTSTGANINLGIGVLFTRNAGVAVQGAAINSANPYVKVDAPEQTNAAHMQMLLQGNSPDGTSPGQCLIGLVSGSAVLSPTTNAMTEVQDSTGDGGLSINCSVATPAQAAVGIYSKAAADRALSVRVTGDTNSRWRSDSNGKQEWSSGGAGVIDTNLYRGAANLLQTDDALAFTNLAAPGVTSGAGKLFSSGGQLATVNPFGLQQTLQTAGLSSTNTNTVTAAAFTSLSFVSIPAGDASFVNCVYKLLLFGYGTWGSTQQNLTFGIRFGAAATNTIGVTPVISSSALSASAAFQWNAAITLTLVTNPGLTTATWRASIEGIVAETANPLNPGSVGANSIPFVGGTGSSDITLDASIAESFGLSAMWAATTGAPTISKSFAQFERTA